MPEAPAPGGPLDGEPSLKEGVVSKKEQTGLKDYFVAGLFSILPLVFTVWVAKYLLVLAWQSFFSLFVPLTDRGMQAVADPGTVEAWKAWHLNEKDHRLRPDPALWWWCRAFFARRFVGSGLLKLVDKIIQRIPGVNWIYSTIHQLTDTMDPASPQHDAFRKPVLVQMEQGYLLGFLIQPLPCCRGPKRKRLATVFFPCNQLIQGYNLLVEEPRAARPWT